MKNIDASGIRKAPPFDMSRSMKRPDQPIDRAALISMSPPSVRNLCHQEAIEAGHNAYTVTQGIPELRGKIQATVDAEFGHADRQVLVTAGTSGALLLALSCVVDPGDEVIVFDPYFVMYRHLATLAGGVSVLVDTYPDFRIDARRVEAIIDRSRPKMRGGQYTTRPIRPGSSARPTKCASWASSAAGATSC